MNRPPLTYKPLSANQAIAQLRYGRPIKVANYEDAIRMALAPLTVKVGIKKVVDGFAPNQHAVSIFRVGNDEIVARWVGTDAIGVYWVEHRLAQHYRAIGRYRHDIHYGRRRAR